MPERVNVVVVRMSAVTHSGAILGVYQDDKKKMQRGERRHQGRQKKTPKRHRGK